MEVVSVQILKRRIIRGRVMIRLFQGSFLKGIYASALCSKVPPQGFSGETSLVSKIGSLTVADGLLPFPEKSRFVPFVTT